MTNFIKQNYIPIIAITAIVLFVIKVAIYLANTPIAYLHLN